MAIVTQAPSAHERGAISGATGRSAAFREGDPRESRDRGFLMGYFFLETGKLVSLGCIETSVVVPAATFGFCCLGFLCSRLPRC
jgi:hypothetical protein